MRSKKISNYDWTSHVLQHSLSEVRKFLVVINSSDDNKRQGSFFYSSCLAMLIDFHV